MWQRFDEVARKAVFSSQEEAQKFGESHVATEHLLLGLVREPDSAAARTLEKLGVSLNRVRVMVERELSKGDARPSQDMTLTPRAKRAIDLAYEEALGLNDDYIGAEHLLLGLIREGNGLASRVLAILGIELERAREAVRLVRTGPESVARIVPPPRLRKVSPFDYAPYPWEAFDEGARSALYRAKSEAEAMGEVHLSPLHLICGLLDDPSSGAVRTLKEAGLDVDRFREAIDRYRVWAVGAPGDLRFSPNGRRAMDEATLEAKRLGSERMGAEHLLLGMMYGNPEGVGKILTLMGVTMEGLRTAAEKVGKEALETPPDPESRSPEEG